MTVKFKKVLVGCIIFATLCSYLFTDTTVNYQRSLTVSTAVVQDSQTLREKGRETIAGLHSSSVVTNQVLRVSSHGELPVGRGSQKHTGNLRQGALDVRSSSLSSSKTFETTNGITAAHIQERVKNTAKAAKLAPLEKMTSAIDIPVSVIDKTEENIHKASTNRNQIQGIAASSNFGTQTAVANLKTHNRVENDLRVLSSNSQATRTGVTESILSQERNLHSQATNGLTKLQHNATTHDSTLPDLDGNHAQRHPILSNRKPVDVAVTSSEAKSSVSTPSASTEVRRTSHGTNMLSLSSGGRAMTLVQDQNLQVQSSGSLSSSQETVPLSRKSSQAIPEQKSSQNENVDDEEDKQDNENDVAQITEDMTEDQKDNAKVLKKLMLESAAKVPLPGQSKVDAMMKVHLDGRDKDDVSNKDSEKERFYRLMYGRSKPNTHEY